MKRKEGKRRKRRKTKDEWLRKRGTGDERRWEWKKGLMGVINEKEKEGKDEKQGIGDKRRWKWKKGLMRGKRHRKGKTSG